MASRPEARPDWRDEVAYAHLLEADRSAFAWEWLRRQDAYREAWKAAARGGRVGGARSGGRPVEAAQWGLHRFEDPALPTPIARPLWRREIYPYVLVADAVAEAPAEDRFDLERFAPLATLCERQGADGMENLLLSDGYRSVRLDIGAGTVRRGSVRLDYRLGGFASARAPLLVLRRLLALRSNGRFSPVLHARESRAGRWIALLRTHDALAAGANQREIAEVLLSREASEPRWRVFAPTVRSRIQRLARSARELSAGGYVSLLASRGMFTPSE